MGKVGKVRFYDPFIKRWRYEETPFEISEGIIATYPFVDLHTHVRLNGGEDYETLTESAIIGGYGVLNIQPNTVPNINSQQIIEEHIKLSSGKPIKYFFTVSPFKNYSISKSSYKKHISGYSTDGIKYTTKEFWDFLNSFDKTDKKYRLFDHSQYYELSGSFYLGTNLPNSTRPYSNESLAIYRTVSLGLEAGSRKFHIQHVSTLQSVELIEFFKKKKVNITTEVTPHHVYFIPEDINHPNRKINPPISKDRDILVKMAKKGIIDAFSTDHAPHPEKTSEYEKAPYGSSHIEVAFSVFFTVFEDIKLLAEKMIVAPSKILGITKKELKNSMVLLDLDASFRVDASKFKSKGKNCAFDGETLKGKIVGLKLNGKWVMLDGEVFVNQEKHSTNY